ncbi:YggT family protein [Euzebya tangerina]|uniref:YggT family protein n=1 Tax=Euzebya tangerina TaxID=591198 RepID=UPI000E31D631|nr:YggT family protein [Euzebya tangerina]
MELISVIVCPLLTIFLILLIVRVIFSWIPRPPEPLMPVEKFSRTTTEWAVEPLRKVIPPVRMGAVALDLSIIVLFLGVNILQGLICR